MQINLKELTGPWEQGFALDKHSISSSYTGDNEYGRPTFDTIRTEAGEALFQLKYRQNFSQSQLLAAEIFNSITSKFHKNIGLIIPVPPSAYRNRQPVLELANSLSSLMERPVFDNILVKKELTPQLKNEEDKQSKIKILMDKFYINDAIDGNKKWNALLIDDLYDTGATLEAAANMLKGYSKIDSIYVATATWK